MHLHFVTNGFGDNSLRLKSITNTEIIVSNTDRLMTERVGNTNNTRYEGCNSLIMKKLPRVHLDKPDSRIWFYGTL